jgi:GntR family transcriptional repressor for pyruvate dehydrogenase complex
LIKMSTSFSVSERTPAFAKVKRRRVFEDICDQIRQKLARGEYKPGDKLPSERDLAAELGVGRPALREALRTLENAGILLLKKGVRGGAFVREGNPETITQSLRDLLSLGHISLPALMEARRVLTSSVLKMACERGTPEEFDAIQRNIEFGERLSDSSDYEELLATGTEYFRLMAAAAHNDVLMLLVDSITVIVRYMVINVRPSQNIQTDIARREILAQMRRRDVVAAQKGLDCFFDIVEAEFRRADKARKRASKGALE